jgi:hypothetical protein
MALWDLDMVPSNTYDEEHVMEQNKKHHDREQKSRSRVGSTDGLSQNI